MGPTATVRARLRLLVAASLLSTGLLLTPATPALAHHECSGVPNRVSVASGVIELSRSGTISRTVGCPESAPWAWYWSSDKSSRAVTVTAAPTGSNHGVRFMATNWSPTSRPTVIFYAGCSATSQGGGPP